MEKQTLETAKRRLKMGIPLQAPEEKFKGESIVSYLMDELHVSNTMLAALLEVTERTVANWRDQSTEDLRGNGKSQRLMALYDFVVSAEKKKVNQKLLINLLQEPINEEDAESKSPLYYIVNEPRGLFFGDAANLLIDKFLK